MAGQIFLRVGAGKPRIASAAFPQPLSKDGTNFPVEYLAYDASTEEAAYWSFKLPTGYTGDITVKIVWNAASATSGDVKWGASLAAYTPDTDTGSWEAKAFAAETTVTDTQLGTTAARLMTCSIVITGASLDSAAVGDICILKIARKAADGADTMTGDANLAEQIELSW